MKNPKLSVKDDGAVTKVIYSSFPIKLAAAAAVGSNTTIENQKI